MVRLRKDGQALIGKAIQSLPTVGFIPLYGKTVQYPVLYERAISGIEGALRRGIAERLQDPEERRSLAAVAAFTLADRVQRAEDLTRIRPEEVLEESLAVFNRIGRPASERFLFHLIPKGMPPAPGLWKYGKHTHDLFISVEKESA